MKVAILGASGFIGSRMVEMFHLGGSAEVRPIVRSFSGLARLARFDLDWRIADACDEKAVTAALEGCDAVVHSVMGQLEIVQGSIAPTYRAACKAGVRRFVYLSTASVHGQAPPTGTDENSQLSDQQAQEYNNCKVRAERQLLRERARGSTEVVILRPGIVFGPRDRWVTSLADAFLRGNAYLVGDGTGICNSIYVDNLVHAIQLAMIADCADREAFLVGDAETVTWADFYQRIAQGMGISPGEIRRLVPPVFSKSFRHRVDKLRNLKATQSVLPYIPTKFKRTAKAALSAWPELQVRSPWALPEPPVLTAPMEMADLHQCRHKLKHEKAKRILGYKPIVSFDEGCRRSVEWLRFAGFLAPSKLDGSKSGCP